MSQNLYINHSLWWSWAAVMWMGCEVAPKALSTRFIAGMWYLFTLIMVSSYTANLAGLLRMVTTTVIFNITVIVIIPSQMEVAPHH